MKPNLSFALILTAGSLLVTRTPLHASETDDRIEASAKKSYVFKTYLAEDSVKTEAKDGVVTLTGTVSQASHRALAQDTVEGLPGVTGVDNRITVKGDGPAERSDGWLVVKVKSVLLFHRNVSASGTEVMVKEGVLTLRGEASSQAQKELTGEYAKDVEGIRDVKNEMTVSTETKKPAETTGEKIDDASITAQVKSSLFWHRSTSAIKTKVRTVDGVVTVSGVAKNAAEKSLVTKLASDVVGVLSVVNEMTVEITAASAR